MAKRVFSLLILSLTVIFNSFSQETIDQKEYFDEGMYFFNRVEYEDALFYFLKLSSEAPENSNFQFKVGECYLNIAGKEQLAIPYLEKAVRHTVPKRDYNKRDYTETMAPLHAIFYLGNAYRADNQLDNALTAYQNFIGSPYFYGEYNLNVVEREIKSCERAKIIQDAPINFVKINLGKAINSPEIEEKPIVSGDGNTLVFLRRLKFYNAIYFARKIDGVWTDAVNINPQVLSDGDFYPTGLSLNGNKLLLVKKTLDLSDIYISELENGVWGEAKLLSGKVNSTFNETYASFGSTEEIIYLSSDKNGGKGGFDLYISKYSESGNWSKPKNLGSSINTEFDEQSPFFCHDNSTLFFSSNGHYNMGGYDIFYTTPKGKKWNVPVNLGYPINNTRDNFGFCPAVTCRQGYYSLDDQEGEGNFDIYLIQLNSDNILNFDTNKQY